MTSGRETPPDGPADITEPMIATLVHSFYDRVRRDPELGPIFNTAIHDWDAHLAKLCAFWSSVTLMSGRYKGTPMQAHAALPGLGPAHFARWLALFEDTAREECPANAARVFVEKAHRIAASLQLGLGLARGELTPAIARQR